MSDDAPEPQADALTAAAHELRDRHTLSARRAAPLPAWAAVGAMRGWLRRARTVLAEPSPELAKAAEWLLDNDYLVERAAWQIEHDLPLGFYARLPSLADGEQAGQPRVHAVACCFLEATRLQVSLGSAVAFANAYQDGGSWLSIAELWAFPTMLRLACLEILVSALERLAPGIVRPFPPGPGTAPPTLDDTESVARAIGNLGIVASVPWKDFFVRTSRVEAILRGDPAGVYAASDFETRDRCRAAIETLARRTGRSEPDVAEHVVAQARRTPSPGAKAAHVGHWLIGDGREALARAIGQRPTRSEAVAGAIARRPAVPYALALCAVTAATVALPAAYAVARGAPPLAAALAIAVSLLPASALGVTLVHWAVTLLVRPRVLPKLDFGRGIAPGNEAAIVVPALVGEVAEAERLLERLEGHYLANPDRTLRFALLVDLPDAPEEQMPGDAPLVEALVSGVRALNARYAGAGRGPFHVLCRPRRFNPSEGCAMGWERKRGKLEEFDRLVTEGVDTGFSTHEGDRDALRAIRFVVTVDADTTLPPGSVVRLVGTIAHPLNRAEFDETTGRVSSGYTVVQPRIEISPESANRSRFAGIYSGDTTIDIYTRAVSDVYQDLFGSGIYVGKGIYDVRAFRRSLEGRVPENALASHDLFEGIHGRAALADDIVCYEAFPARYVEFARRWHRWVRGDWQLLPWLRRRVPGAHGTRCPNPLSALDRWKILDNLRRSLLPPALVAMLAAAWLVLPAPALWTILALAATAGNLATDLVLGVTRGRWGAFRGPLGGLGDRLGRWALEIVFLPHDAVIAIDAIARTLWRLGVSRRGLLEWTSAAQTAAHFATENGLSAWREMRNALGLTAGLAIAVIALRPGALGYAAPLLLLWLASPAIAAGLSRPRIPPRDVLGTEDRTFLRHLARRTWLYFERFVGPDDHWLPPDNFQEEPSGDVAHRTSPTNVGMTLLSTVAAADLGYIGLPELAVRLRNTLGTLERLERHRGHFLNWYDTESLDPLEPRYVSTVDSGNLAAGLLATKESCIELARGPGLRGTLWDGFADVLGLLAHALEGVGHPGNPLRVRIARVRDDVVAARHDPLVWHRTIARVCAEDCPEIARLLTATVAPGGVREESLREVRTWLERTHHHARTMERDVETLLPWLSLTESPPPGCEDVARRLAKLLPPTVSLEDVPDRCAQGRALLDETAAGGAGDEAARGWRAGLRDAIERGSAHADVLHRSLLDAAAETERYALDMDFSLLFDPDQRLFHIGYALSSARLDPHHYDLLATEARLASLVAIAKGDVPLEHWFHLGRPVTATSAGLALMSWGGSMFEYLMPPLLLQSVPGTLLGQSERAAVDVQRHLGEQLGVPWGVSESGFGSLDPERHYRYRAFGVPGLGLRRGLGRDLVVAPYASALALPFRPRAAAENLRTCVRLGWLGTYGLYEAADFTPERVPQGRRFVLVRSHMAHHQGMILVALANALCGEALVRRFAADPHMHGVSLLLHERIPKVPPPEVVEVEERVLPAPRRPALPTPGPWVPITPAPFPQVHALGNGRLAAWISEAGAGALHWQDQALTRWLPDATCDDHGLWIYVRDEESGAVWSAGRQPTGVAAEEARVLFHPHLAEFHRRDHGVALRMEVGVAPADDLEIRRITVVNESDRPRVLTLTSYGEVVLAPPLEDERHPAFSKLFVHSEHVATLDGLLFVRCPHRPDERPPCLLHRVLVEGDHAGVAFESDRRAFLGRHGDPRRPRGVVDGLAGTVGWTLDPVMAVQVRIRLAPQERRDLAFVTVASGSRESALEIAERHATLASLEWALRDAANEAAHEAQRLGLAPDALPALQLLASLLVHPHAARRAPPATRAANALGQPSLWGFGISGDLPLLLLRVRDPGDRALLGVVVRGLQLWRRHGLHADLVVLRLGTSGYVEPFREGLYDLLRETGADELLGHRGGIHLLFADQIGAEQQRLLEATASVILDDADGPLERQLASATIVPPELPRFDPGGTPAAPTPQSPWTERLRLENGFGGFTEDGREYVIRLAAGEHTPAPWANVLANDDFGCVVTEAGGGFTWGANSGEHRLTPWSNDPVLDSPGEVLYLRDEETGELWTPTPRPAGAEAACEIRHGAGYTEWRRSSHGFAQTLRVFVAPDDPVKVARLHLRNLGERRRRVTATYYVEWVLGALRSAASPGVVCEYDATSQVAFARNPWAPEFGARTAFLAATLPLHGLTLDRRRFLGREGDRGAPAALRRWGLSGRTRGSADPCTALQVHLDVAPSAIVEVAFVLGEGHDREHAGECAARWRDLAAIDCGSEALRAEWDRRLDAVRVRTPDATFDVLVNRWLLYQTLASRVLARAGFHQAGGAIGFRDQLQDVLALVYADPARTRRHILACAAHQFEEGDVLHWWHPPSGRGVRTRCADDLLWLPYAVARYVEATGDAAILDEEVPFLHAPRLAPGETDRYAQFPSTAERRTLFEHCARAIARGVTRGPHALPLIGSGDWNDGMNRVGVRGRGESVWLAWFAVATLEGFVGLCRRRGDVELADRWRRQADELVRTIDAVAWDGAWYVRAFDDDGRPWGSAGGDECRIDSIAQSWAVLAGGPPSARARQAVAAAERELVVDDPGLVRLLWPPFEHTPRDPGYIRSYPPGIRENGGQYTHAAAWLGLAMAELGDGDRASRIFGLLNPIRQTATRAAASRYRAEPYVLAADVAATPPHVGRAGWTWYTGSAAWTWRLAVEGILGLRLRGGSVAIDPRIPADWKGFEAEIAGPAGRLAVRVEDPDGVGAGVRAVVVDGAEIEGALVALPRDGSTRHVTVRLGRVHPAESATPPFGRARSEGSAP